MEKIGSLKALKIIKETGILKDCQVENLEIEGLSIARLEIVDCQISNLLIKECKIGELNSKSSEEELADEEETEDGSFLDGALDKATFIVLGGFVTNLAIENTEVFNTAYFGFLEREKTDEYYGISIESSMFHADVAVNIDFYKFRINAAEFKESIHFAESPFNELKIGNSKINNLSFNLIVDMYNKDVRNEVMLTDSTIDEMQLSNSKFISLNVHKSNFKIFCLLNGRESEFKIEKSKIEALLIGVAEVLIDGELEEWDDNLDDTLKCAGIDFEISDSKVDMTKMPHGNEFNNFIICEDRFKKSFVMNDVKIEKLGIYDTKFNCYADISGNEMIGDTYILGNAFKKGVSFEKSKFIGEFNFGEDLTEKFSDNKDETVEEWKPNEVNNRANFLNCSFEKQALFNKTVFNGDVIFYNAQFAGETHFDLCSFSTGSLNFTTIFCSAELDFDGASFKNVSAIFDEGIVDKRISLADIKIEDDEQKPNTNFSFSNTITNMVIVDWETIKERLFYENILLGKPYNKNDRRLSYNKMPPTKDAIFQKAIRDYILLKDTFNKRGMHIEEDIVYFKMMHLKTLREINDTSVLRKISGIYKFIIFEKMLGWGIKLRHIVFSIIILIFLFAGAINSFGVGALNVNMQITNNTFLQSLKISGQTFFAILLGEWQPKPNSGIDIVLTLEAIIGIFFVTFFVGAYVRKVLR